MIYLSLSYYRDIENLQYEPCWNGIKQCLKSGLFELNIIKGSLIHRNRNRLITTDDSYDDEGWLHLDKYKIKECSHFWIFDHDIEFTLNDVMIALSHKKQNIGFPYIKNGDTCYNVETNTPQKSLEKVFSQGLGARLIERSVFEKIPPFWFGHPVLQDGQKIKDQSEDFDFDSKCHEYDIDVWCDFTNPLKHKPGVTTMDNKKMTASKIARNITNNANSLADAIDQLNDLCASKDKEIQSLKDKIAELEKK